MVDAHKRQALQQHFYEHAQAMGEDPGSLAGALIQAGLQILVDGSRAPVGPDDFAAIQRAYPPATMENAKAHHLTDVGLANLLAMITMAGRKYLDHQPLADATAARESDAEKAMDRLSGLGAVLTHTYDSFQSDGASTYGIFATLILHATLRAQKRGLPLVQIANVLLETIQVAMDQSGGPKMTQKQADDLAIEALAAQLGVSESTAKKYLREARAAESSSGK
jgi:hypothetical protein